jgi:hypothetical protein
MISRHYVRFIHIYNKKQLKNYVCCVVLKNVAVPIFPIRNSSPFISACGFDSILSLLFPLSFATPTSSIFYVSRES